MSQFLPPEGTPPPADEPEQFNLRGASNALVQWFNTQKLKPYEALMVMERVTGKIIVDRTRPDVLALADAMDEHGCNVAQAMNDHLLAKRRAERLNWTRKRGGGRGND